VRITRIVCVLAILLPIMAWSPRPSLAAAGIRGISRPSGPNVPVAGDFQFINLKDTTNLWADGHGDNVIEQTLLNNDLAGFGSFTWCYDWPSASYTNIYAYDDIGPLQVVPYWNTSTQECMTAYFRSVLAIGAIYHFAIAVSIGGMASGSQNSWEASWYIQPGSGVNQFQEIVKFPSNATLNSISPTPSSQVGNSLEWDLSNTSSGDQIAINVLYTLSAKITITPILQTTSPWGGHPYAWNKPGGDGTIGNYGCCLTDVVMLINYSA
jgi:hypothetical protein